MNRFAMWTVFAATLAANTGLVAADATPGACAVLSDAEAARLVGATLGETDRLGSPASAQNGNDRKSACGHFPKGYHIETADGPPERGILVELHTMPTAGAARRFYEGILGMHVDNAKTPQARADSAIVAMAGIGEGAYLKPTALADPAARITTLTFLKGSTVASVQVWKTAAPVDEIARAAALQIAGRLP